MLSSQVVADVKDGGLVDGMGAWQRVIGFATSKMYEQMTQLYTRRVTPARVLLAAAEAGADAREIELARRAEQIAASSVGDEVAVELSWSMTRAQRAVEIALTLSGRIPRTLDALADGSVEAKKADVLASELGALSDDDLVARVEELVLPGASGWNVPQLREQIKAAILRAAPEVAAERAAKARATRRVRFWSEPDDMMRMEALLSADEGIRLQTALDIAQAAAKTPGDTRTADQRRIDTLVDGAELVAEALVDADADEDGAADLADVAELDADGEADDVAASGRTSASGNAPGGPARERATSRRPRVRRHARIRRALRREVVLTVPLETITGDADEPIWRGMGRSAPTWPGGWPGRWRRTAGGGVRSPTVSTAPCSASVGRRSRLRTRPRSLCNVS